MERRNWSRETGLPLKLYSGLDRNVYLTLFVLDPESQESASQNSTSVWELEPGEPTQNLSLQGASPMFVLDNSSLEIFTSLAPDDSSLVVLPDDTSDLGSS